MKPRYKVGQLNEWGVDGAQSVEFDSDMHYRGDDPPSDQDLILAMDQIKDRQEYIRTTGFDMGSLAIRSVVQVQERSPWYFGKYSVQETIDFSDIEHRAAIISPEIYTDERIIVDDVQDDRSVYLLDEYRKGNGSPPEIGDVVVFNKTIKAQTKRSISLGDRPFDEYWAEVLANNWEEFDLPQLQGVFEIVDADFGDIEHPYVIDFHGYRISVRKIDELEGRPDLPVEKAMTLRWEYI